MMTSQQVSAPKPNMAKNVVVRSIAEITTSLLGLVPIIFAPRYLGDVGMGRLTLAVSFTGIFSALILMGTSIYTTREIARDSQRLDEIVSSAIVLRTTLALILLPVMAALLYLLRYPEQTSVVVLIMYGAVAVRMVGATFASALQGLGNQTWRSGTLVIKSVVTVTIGWLVLYSGGGVIGYVLVLAAGDIIELITNLLYFVVVAPVRPIVRWSGVTQMFRGGVPFFLWAFLQTIYAQISSLMLSKLAGEAAVGWAGLANQFVNPLFMIPSVATAVLLPQLSQLHVLEPSALRHNVSRATRTIALITIPLAFGLFAVAGRVIDLFHYPDTFQHSVRALEVNAFTFPASALLMVLATAVAAMNKERSWAKISLFSVIAVTVLSAIFIPLARIWLENAAIGAVGADLVAEVLTLGLVLHLLGSAMLDRSVFVVLGKTSAAATLMAAIVRTLAWLPLPVVIFVGGLVYVGLVFLLHMVPPDELELIRGRMRGLWQRSESTPPYGHVLTEDELYPSVEDRISR